MLSSSLIYSIKSYKMKTSKKQGVGACSLVRSTLGVEGRVGALGWDQEKCQTTNQSRESAQTKQQVGQCMSLNTFGAKTSHDQTRTHKTHHGLDLGEATTFPLVVYYAPLHTGHIQMTFCPRTPKWES